MHITKRHGLAPSRYTLLASAMLAAALPSAHAVEIDTGNPDWTARLDNTVKYNYGVRTESTTFARPAPTSATASTC
jgi:hypothetical protein